MTRTRAMRLAVVVMMLMPLGLAAEAAQEGLQETFEIDILVGSLDMYEPFNEATAGSIAELRDLTGQSDNEPSHQPLTPADVLTERLGLLDIHGTLHQRLRRAFWPRAEDRSDVEATVIPSVQGALARDLTETLYMDGSMKVHDQSRRVIPGGEESVMRVVTDYGYMMNGPIECFPPASAMKMIESTTTLRITPRTVGDDEIEIDVFLSLSEVFSDPNNGQSPLAQSRGLQMHITAADNQPVVLPLIPSEPTHTVVGSPAQRKSQEARYIMLRARRVQEHTKGTEV